MCAIGIEFFNGIPDPQYYLNEPSFPEPAFEGKASRMMGIEGTFSAELHLRLYDGLDQDGKRLPGMRASANRQGGWDITFNQPKAVSVLEQVSQDARIADVRTQARNKAMKLLESQVRVAVRKKSQLDAPRIKGWKYPERISGNIVWAAFRHPAGRDGAPHSHDYVVVYNASYDKVERQWKAAVTRHVDFKAIDNVFHTEMAKGLRKLGYHAHYDGKLLSIRDFPKDIHEEFSQRHTAIKELEQTYQAKAAAFQKVKGLPVEPKPMSAKAKGKLSLYHRPDKEYVPIESRRKNWLGRMTDLQKRVLYGMVEKARLSTALDRWQAGVKHHVTKLRSIAREHDHAREAGIER